MKYLSKLPMLAAACLLVACQTPASMLKPPVAAHQSVAAPGTIVLSIVDPVERHVLAEYVPVFRNLMKNLAHYTVKLQRWDGTAYVDETAVAPQKAGAGSTATFTHLRPARYQVVVVGIDIRGAVCTQPALVEYDLERTTGDLDEAPMAKVAQMVMANVVYAGTMALPRLGVSGLVPHWATTMRATLTRPGAEPLVANYPAGSDVAFENLKLDVDYSLTLSATGAGRTTTSAPQRVSAGAKDWDENGATVDIQAVDLMQTVALSHSSPYTQPDGLGGVWAFAYGEAMTHVKADGSLSTRTVPQDSGELEPDGSGGVWYQSQPGGYGTPITIHHITASDTPTSTDVPSAGVMQRIKADGLGGLWVFSHDGAQKILHMTAAHRVNIDHMALNFVPSSLAVDGAGGLWLSSGTTALGHMDALGTVVTLGQDYLHNREFTDSMVTGPNGSMWFKKSDLGVGARALINIAPGDDVNATGAHPTGIVTPTAYPNPNSIATDNAQGVWVGGQTYLVCLKADNTVMNVANFSGSAEYLKADGQGGVWSVTRREGGQFFEHVTAAGAIDRSFAAGPDPVTTFKTYAPSGQHMWGTGLNNTINHIFIPPTAVL